MASKVVKVASSRFPWIPLSCLPEPTPLMCAVLMFVSQLPGLIVASTRRSNVKLIEAVVYCSLCSFMLAWHVHEKAIMTALIPLTLLVCHIDDEDQAKGYSHSLLFWQMSLWGLLGLFPLLFRPVELTFKVISYITFMALAIHFSKDRFGTIRKLCSVLVGIVILILEILPIQGKWEFLPLMITSIVCALGLIACWIVCLIQLLTVETAPAKNKNI